MSETIQNCAIVAGIAGVLITLIVNVNDCSSKRYSEDAKSRDLCIETGGTWTDRAEFGGSCLRLAP
jgi:hypothetical protein